MYFTFIRKSWVFMLKSSIWPCLSFGEFQMPQNFHCINSTSYQTLCTNKLDLKPFFYFWKTWNGKTCNGKIWNYKTWGGKKYPVANVKSFDVWFWKIIETEFSHFYIDYMSWETLWNQKSILKLFFSMMAKLEMEKIVILEWYLF